MKNKKLFIASLGVALSLAGMILQVFVMVVTKKLELFFFFYLDFVFYYNLKTYIREKYRLEGRDQYGFKVANAPLPENVPNQIERKSEIAGLVVASMILMMLVVFGLRIWFKT